MSINTKDYNSGLSNNAEGGSVRFFNKNGVPNVIKTGTNVRNKFSIYYTLLNMSNTVFFSFILLFYFLVNIVFAEIYMLVGPEHIGLTTANNCKMLNYSNCFFFSAQTLTTVGYGRLSPSNFAANTVSALESLLGLILFALVTGLCYGRFSKPKSKLWFSKNALVSPYEDSGTGLMCRVVPPTNHNLSDAEVSITLAIMEENNGKISNQFYPLKLESTKIASFVLNWTIVHPITTDSPIYGLTHKDLIERKAEILVFIRGFDEHYSATVQQRSSYTANEIVFDAKFTPMYTRDVTKNKTILNLSLLNDYNKLS